MEEIVYQSSIHMHVVVPVDTMVITVNLVIKHVVVVHVEMVEHVSKLTLDKATLVHVPLVTLAIIAKICKIFVQLHRA